MHLCSAFGVQCIHGGHEEDVTAEPGDPRKRGQHEFFIPFVFVVTRVSPGSRS